MISWFRQASRCPNAGCMTLGQAALDLWAAGIVVALGCIGMFFVAGAVLSLLTVVRARRRSLRPRRELGQLARCSSVSELADIDDALDRVLSEEHGGMPGVPR